MFAEVRRNVLALDSRAQIVPVSDQLHLHQVDDAVEVLAFAVGQLHGDGVAVEPLHDHPDAAVKVRADAVELVDKADARHVILVGLPPDRFGLRLDACHAVKNHHPTIQHAQTPLHFGGEVHVPGGIDDVDLMSAPKRRHSGGGDGDPALFFLVHVVGGGGAVVHFAHAVDTTGVVEHALGGGRLPRVNMGDDADIAQRFQV